MVSTARRIRMSDSGRLVWVDCSCQHCGESCKGSCDGAKAACRERRERLRLIERDRESRQLALLIDAWLEQ